MVLTYMKVMQVVIVKILVPTIAVAFWQVNMKYHSSAHMVRISL